MFVVLFDTNLDARVFRQWRRACGVVDTNLDARVFRHVVVVLLTPILKPEFLVNGIVGIVSLKQNTTKKC